MNAFLTLCSYVLCVLLGLGAIAGTLLFVACAMHMQKLEKKEAKP